MIEARARGDGQGARGRKTRGQRRKAPGRKGGRKIEEDGRLDEEKRTKEREEVVETDLTKDAEGGKGEEREVLGALYQGMATTSQPRMARNADGTQTGETISCSEDPLAAPVIERNGCEARGLILACGEQKEGRTA
ncbi:hypothetical protein N7532_008010 [Penicillium argentinense]|uniref:Uncharacterized protein n=1 Tax=Penicillium argentinense TaxID=1131581 RepID=A0A9W9K1L5_9EURO|nr:uncharacterized protein N7532_008010 [Penicillium argentinense]KAJ5089326.1 hypothetical protein N7532_008010 [Penicillium argentinense]